MINHRPHILLNQRLILQILHIQHRLHLLRRRSLQTPNPKLTIIIFVSDEFANGNVVSNNQCYVSDDYLALSWC